jgi:putative chitinase
MMNREQLLAIMPHADAGAWLAPLNAAMHEFEITTTPRIAAFLANLAVESDELRTLEENLNYSATGLASTWPKRYANADGTPNALALKLSRKPREIANNVYADRMGNGAEASGDGWTYRGAGPIQTTGKDNQLAAAKRFSIAPERIGAWLRTPEGGARSAALFFMQSGCNKLADAGDFDGVCDTINRGKKTPAIGDAIGYKARAAYYATACKTLRGN